MTVADTDLERRMLCSWMPGGSPDPLMGPSLKTLRWALLERFGGPTPSLTALRAKFVLNWTKQWGDRKKDGQEYWAGPNGAVSFGARVYPFLLKHEVVHPLEPYKLELPEGVIEGEFALLAQTRQRKPAYPYVLDFCLRRPKETRVPNYGALAKWLSARQDSDEVDLGIAHLPLLYGEPWFDDSVDEALARKWLGAMLSQPEFPRPGSHCRSCSHPCKVFRNGQDDHNWD